MISTTLANNLFNRLGEVLEDTSNLGYNKFPNFHGESGDVIYVAVKLWQRPNNLNHIGFIISTVIQGETIVDEIFVYLDINSNHFYPNIHTAFGGSISTYIIEELDSYKEDKDLLHLNNIKSYLEANITKRQKGEGGQYRKNKYD